MNRRVQTYSQNLQRLGLIVKRSGFAFQKVLLERYTTAGALDTSFDGDGHLEVTVVGSTATGAYAVALQPGGKIVAAGTSNGNVAAVRVEADGSLDASFAGGGTMTVNFGANSVAYDVAVDASDGSLVLAGVVSGDVLLARVHAGGELSERHYAVHDANYNVTALTDRDGAVVERYVFDPYGARTVLDANWAADADGLSDVAWLYGHQGGRHDLTAKLVHFRYRDMQTSLGRWTSQDPAGYADGLNLFET